jgi:hypothetical protein
MDEPSAVLGIAAGCLAMQEMLAARVQRHLCVEA